jgi:hypothetical protein
MKTVFEPSNSLEGYMLQDLLKQRGIDSRLDGAHLQGGVGELPASGLVRLVVSEEDFVAARAVIDDWESAHVTDPIPAPARRVPMGFAGALAACWWALPRHTPTFVFPRQTMASITTATARSTSGGSCLRPGR